MPSPVDLASGWRATFVIRLVADYQLLGSDCTRERMVFTVTNASPEPIRVVALLPQLSGHFVKDMAALIDGHETRPLMPSETVTYLVQKALNPTALGAEETAALGRCLQNPDGDGHSASVLENRVDNRSAPLGSDDDALLRRVMGAARHGKMTPFVGLSKPLEPWQQLQIELRREAIHPLSAPLRIWGLVFGRYRARLRFSIGKRHSTHITVSAPEGTLLGQRDLPKHWPKAVAQEDHRAGQWHIYIPKNAKHKIWRRKAKLGTTPEDDDYHASIGLVTPAHFHFLLFGGYAALAVLFRVFPDQTLDASLSATTPYSLLGIVGGALATGLFTSSSKPLVFRYLSFQSLILALLGVLWLFHSSLDGALRNLFNDLEGHSVVLPLGIAVSIASSLKELVSGLYAWAVRLKYP